MTQSMHQLLASVINYSGLYPPANLKVQEALGNYVDFSNSKYAWMASNFVMPHTMLTQLASFADRKHRLKGSLSLCLTAPETETLFEFKNVINKMEQSILSVHSNYPGEIRTNILEVKFPLQSVQNLNAEELVKALEAVVKSAAESRLLPHRVYFEVPGDNVDADLTKKIIKVIAVHNKSILKRKVDNYLFSALKINCSKEKGRKVPTSEYLAEVLLYARDANVAVKFSGNENTPLPSYNYTIESKTHGFLNILMASILAYTQDLNRDEMIEVLEERTAENFSFKEDYFSWRELAAPVMEIKMLRMLSITSFNFTSFSAPIAGLKDLGYL